MLTLMIFCCFAMCLSFAVQTFAPRRPLWAPVRAGSYCPSCGRGGWA